MTIFHFWSNYYKYLSGQLGPVSTETIIQNLYPIRDPKPCTQTGSYSKFDHPQPRE